MVRTRKVVRLDGFGGPDVMRWVEEPILEPGPEEVSVAVEAVGVNFADTMVRRGEYRRDQALEFTPGFEAAGRVLAGPSGGPAPGTRVAVFAEQGGGYASQLCAPRHRVYPVPADTPPTTVAGVFLQGITALYAVERYADVHEGDVVLVHAAAGGVGGLTTQLCVQAGGRVIGTASTAAKREVARRHGATTTIPSEPEGLAAAVRDATGGRGCDAVIDGVGGPLFGPSLKSLAFGGRYVVVGSASQQPAHLDTRALMPRGQTVSGFVVARVAEQDPAEPQRALDRVLDAVASGRLRTDISVLPADDLVHAHELIEGRSRSGKLVLDLDGLGA